MNPPSSLAINGTATIGLTGGASPALPPSTLSIIQLMNGTTFRGHATLTGSTSPSTSLIAESKQHSSLRIRMAASSFGPLGLFGRGVMSRAPSICLFPVTWR
ncbi:unnamed protein product, partial [Prunus brigantina]